MLTMMRTIGIVMGMAAAIAAPAHAQSRHRDLKDSCTTTNCNAQVIDGNYILDSSSNGMPDVLLIYGAAGDCVRLEVVSQTTDHEMELVSPDGTVWRNDDGGSCTNCPLIKANPFANGYHTLTLHRFDGLNPTGGYRLMYGRYPVNSVQCADPTLPLVEQAPPG